MLFAKRHFALVASLAFAAAALVIGPQTQAAGEDETPVTRD